MTDARKLEALIQRAIEGGWDVPIGAKFVRLVPPFEDYIEFTSEHQKEYHESVYAVLFQHSFARALFGEDQLFREEHEDDPDIPFVFLGLRWQYHIQQAVISPNPIAYMYEAVFGNPSHP